MSPSPQLCACWALIKKIYFCLPGTGWEGKCRWAVRESCFVITWKDDTWEELLLSEIESVRLKLMKGARGSSLSFHQLFTNSLTKFHKRGQNPHGESHKGGSSPNKAVCLISLLTSAVRVTTTPWVHPRRYTKLLFKLLIFLPSSPSHILSWLFFLPVCVCWCVFHLISLYNEPHFTVKSLMTVIN